MTRCLPLLLLAGCVAAPGTGTPDPDPTPDPLRAELDALVAARGLQPIPAPPPANPARIELGRMLFYDPIVSGPRSHACASCHHPEHHGTDGLPVFIGPGGEGFGPDRQMGDAPAVGTRNTIALYHLEGRLVQTWDGHIAGTPEDGFFTPPGLVLDDRLESLTALSVLRPMAVDDEMLGYEGVPDAYGGVNELAEAGPPDAIWYALLDRLGAIPAYVDLFAAAEPGVPFADVGYPALGNALADFLIATVRADETPWDQYLRGEQDLSGWSDASVRGALLFFGAAQCHLCHDGPYLADDLTHNAGAPQLGLGRGGFEPWDPGAFAEDRDNDELWWRFRTPPLRNVAVTGPWTHAGGYGALEDAVRHMLDPATALQAWDPSWMRPEFEATARLEGPELDDIVARLDPQLPPLDLTDAQVADLVAFLTEALTDPRTADPAHFAVPEAVPSGLPLAL